MKSRILIVDDDPRARDILISILAQENYLVVSAEDGETAIKRVIENDLNLVLLDLMLPGINGIEVLKKIKEIKPTIPVIMISGLAQIKDAVEATKIGAYDFLEKSSFDKDKFLTLIRNALGYERMEREITLLKEEALKKYQMVGFSEPMQKIFSLIDEISHSDATVLITGESGVGKELVARAIHNKSKRKESSFVKINCAAMPDTLIESELFGYEKGAFTGAVAQKKGKLENAHNGTLFLDEIGDLSLSAQAKLLRFIQEGEFERVGGAQTIKVDVRIITATNKNLKDEIINNNFREDQFYRLNVINIYVPPLRERKEEISALADYFLEKYCDENGVPKKYMTIEAIEFLKSLEWKGNVRELENLIERTSILVKAQEIKPQDLIHITQEKSRPVLPDKKTLKDATDEFQKAFILTILADNDGNKAKTAEVLDIERAHLYRKLKDLGIDI
jgi:two-component system nitrogen regulation response regulator NtrX